VTLIRRLFNLLPFPGLLHSGENFPLVIGLMFNQLLLFLQATLDPQSQGLIGF
jgi:hypothetical protein